MAATPESSEVEVRRSPARVVIAEDDPEMRGLLVMALRRDGCDVHATQDARQLLRVLDELSAQSTPQPAVDLVVSDVRMPGMSGLQALAALRAAHPATPVILITAFGDPETHAEAHRLGAVAVFNKPFDLDDLRTVVACLCRPEAAAH